MKIRFFAYLRDEDFANCKETEWSPCCDVKTLGKELSKKFGQKFHDEFFTNEKEDELGERIIVFVNGRRVEFLDGINTKLNPDDEINIFPVVAGG